MSPLDWCLKAVKAQDNEDSDVRKQVLDTTTKPARARERLGNMRRVTKKQRICGF